MSTCRTARQPVSIAKSPVILDRLSLGHSMTDRLIAKEQVSSSVIHFAILLPVLLISCVFVVVGRLLWGSGYFDSSFFICDFIGFCSLLFRMTELLANGGLVIRQVRQRDAGTYRCTGGNTLGKISAPAQLRVLSK